MVKKSFLIIILSLFIYSTSLSQDTIRASSDPINREQIKSKSEKTYSERVNDAFSPVVAELDSILFWDPFAAVGLHDPVIYGENGYPVLDENGDAQASKIPFIVIWLIFGAITFTIVMRFVNFRGFKHAIQLVRGVYDDPDDPGEVSHFQALTTALSATVGLGNIAGVAIAISIGGPGATF